MSELHCPARIVVCADPATSKAAELLARERIARIYWPDDAAASSPERTGPGGDGVPSGTERRLAAGADAVRDLLDELVDQHRGECVVLVVPAADLVDLTDLAGETIDREVTIIEATGEPR